MTSRKPQKKNAGDSTTPAARVRENQRRSRARKREYVASLEERLRRCQAEGAERNEMIQAAARKVAAENRALRELLREKGVDENEITARVEVYIQDSGEPTFPSCSNMSANCCCTGFSTSSPSSCPPSSSCGAASASTSSIRQQETSPPPSLEVGLNLTDDSLLSSLVSLPPMISTIMPSGFVQPTSDAAQHIDPLSLVEGSIFASAPASTNPTPLCPCEADSYLYPEAEDSHTSTPCTIAYQLLQAVGLQPNREVDEIIINIELWGAFRAAPLLSFEGCRVENNALVHILTKVLSGSLHLS
ncbi:hypothetical protein FB107DRAFT_275076 [Schizophyllum commune]